MRAYNMANDEKSQVIKAYETIKHDICIRAFQPGSPIVNKDFDIRAFLGNVFYKAFHLQESDSFPYRGTAHS